MATQSEKIGGREPGTPNKITRELKVLIKDLLDNEFETIGEKLDKLDPKDRLDIVVKLLAFVVPKNQKIEQQLTVKEDTGQSIVNIQVHGIPKSLLGNDDSPWQEKYKRFSEMNNNNYKRWVAENEEYADRNFPGWREI